LAALGFRPGKQATFIGQQMCAESDTFLDIQFTMIEAFQGRLGSALLQVVLQSASAQSRAGASGTTQFNYFDY
jgi:hypothetical protein